MGSRNAPQVQDTPRFSNHVQIQFYHERTHDAAGQDGEEPAEAGVCAGSLLDRVYVWPPRPGRIVSRVLPPWTASAGKVSRGGLSHRRQQRKLTRRTQKRLRNSATRRRASYHV